MHVKAKLAQKLKGKEDLIYDYCNREGDWIQLHLKDERHLEHQGELVEKY